MGREREGGREGGKEGGPVPDGVLGQGCEVVLNDGSLALAVVAGFVAPGGVEGLPEILHDEGASAVDLGGFGEGGREEGREGGRGGGL